MSEKYHPRGEQPEQNPAIDRQEKPHRRWRSKIKRALPAITAFTTVAGGLGGAIWGMIELDNHMKEPVSITELATQPEERLNDDLHLKDTYLEYDSQRVFKSSDTSFNILYPQFPGKETVQVKETTFIAHENPQQTGPSVQVVDLVSGDIHAKPEELIPEVDQPKNEVVKYKDMYGRWERVLDEKGEPQPGQYRFNLYWAKKA